MILFFFKFFFLKGEKKMKQYDLILQPQLQHIPFLQWSFTYMTINPYRIILLVDIPEKWIFAFSKFDRVSIVSIKRFPFTLPQITEQCKRSSLSNEYRKQLVIFYCSEVLTELSNDFLVIDPELIITNPLLLFDGDKSVYNWSHGTSVSHITHMTRLLPKLKKTLLVSAKSPWMMCNKKIMYELMHAVTQEHNNTVFWKAYLAVIDPLGTTVSSSWQEIYLNYVAQYHPTTYLLKWHKIETKTWDMLYKAPGTTALCKPQSCIIKNLNYTIPITLVYPYLTVLKQLRERIKKENAIWVDIGCGSFTSVYPFVPWNTLTDKYIGVDCLSDKIVENQLNVHIPSVSFLKLDATLEPLPKGDICMIRNVFQYLCFIHIGSILQQLSNYSIVIITDIQPDGCVSKFNKDKPTDTYRRQTGLWLEEAPFNYTIENVLSLNYEKNTIIRSVVIHQNP